MCGIAGIIGPRPERYMRAMLDTLEHRGRDDEGIWLAPDVGDRRQICLGHRRLAIIDTSNAGHEPMFSANGRYAIVFNGEIYNYRELRQELRSKGVSFRTETDTEVLLAAFAEWGLESLSRLNGMFAFAVWDTHEQTLTLVRDHVGVKPLYYTKVGNEEGDFFLFASEIKALLA